VRLDDDIQTPGSNKAATHSQFSPGPNGERMDSGRKELNGSTSSGRLTTHEGKTSQGKP
jgi:hypothetical protein